MATSSVLKRVLEEGRQWRNKLAEGIPGLLRIRAELKLFPVVGSVEPKTSRMRELLDVSTTKSCNACSDEKVAVASSSLALVIDDKHAF